MNRGYSYFCVSPEIGGVVAGVTSCASRRWKLCDSNGVR